MTENWLKGSVEFEVTGNGNPTPLKRTFGNVKNGASDADVFRFGRAIATLSNDDLTHAALTITQSVTAD